MPSKREALEQLKRAELLAAGNGFGLEIGPRGLDKTRRGVAGRKRAPGEWMNRLSMNPRAAADLLAAPVGGEVSSRAARFAAREARFAAREARFAADAEEFSSAATPRAPAERPFPPAALP